MTRLMRFALVTAGLVLHADAIASDLDPERLTAQEWRLFSDVFPMPPGDGYRVRLHGDGTVQTANLALVARWKLYGGTEVEFQAQDGTTLWTFRWYPEKTLLISCPRSAGAPVPPVVLAPIGSTLASVSDGLKELGLYRCRKEADRP
jgi:hypothetical protein